jgi:hypothetical protein
VQVQDVILGVSTVFRFQIHSRWWWSIRCRKHWISSSRQESLRTVRKIVLQLPVYNKHQMFQPEISGMYPCHAGSFNDACKADTCQIVNALTIRIREIIQHDSFSNPLRAFACCKILMCDERSFENNIAICKRTSKRQRFKQEIQHSAGFFAQIHRCTSTYDSVRVHVLKKNETSKKNY